MSFDACGSHLIIREIGKFDVKVNVLPNGSEKYIAFTVSKSFLIISFYWQHTVYELYSRRIG